MESFIAQSIREIRNNLKGKEWRLRNRIPYLKYREVEVFMEVFRRLKPARILEWGAGFSTLYFPERLEFPFEWYSIEHHRDWFHELEKMNRNEKVKIILKEPEQYPFTDEHGDGSYEDLRSYIDYPGELGGFDCIIIDGRARNDCLLKAEEILNPGGVIILHDANRERYYKYQDRFTRGELFQDYRRSAGGMWIGSPSLSLEDILDLKKHRRRWGLVQNKVAKILSI